MRRELPPKWAVFGASVAIGAVAVAGAFGWQHHRRIPARLLDDGVLISEQLQPESMAELARTGYAKVIDLRPDGEAGDEPSSSVMAAAAGRSGLPFAYVPVPHGDIPESAVEALKKALQGRKGPVLLYCRSGRRAARTWSLVEAGDPHGMGADAILASVHAAGQSADDLRGEIERRVGLRPKASGS